MLNHDDHGKKYHIIFSRVHISVLLDYRRVYLVNVDLSSYRYSVAFNGFGLWSTKVSSV